MREIRWAWRNITARRWRAALTIGLLALALAATTIVFSAADSLVFRRVAYPAADRLITFDSRDAKTGRPGGGFASAAVLDEWQQQTDLFSDVHGHLYKTIFLVGSGEPELVPAADVTVGLLDMLGVGGALYVRSYLALIGLDKGFDSSGVVAISLTMPPQRFGSAAERAALAQTILERLRARPGVLGAFEGSPPPSTGDSPTANDHIEVDGKPPIEANILVPRLWVTPDYFRVLGIPLMAGRMFERGDPPTNVIITEALARRLWPNGDAVGHRFREDPLFEWSHVVGVVKHVRTTYDGTSGPERYFQKYSLKQPPPPVTASMAPTPGSSGAGYGFLTVAARVDSRSRVSDLYRTVRNIDTHNILTVEFVDDQYARQFADRLLATRIMTGFGMLALVVAAAGMYGVMAFLVANRAREIGIRMALGADSRRIRRLVLGSSMWLVLLGAAIGIGGALVASRWAQSQLFGVRATDPITIGLVTVAVALTALLATWHPARQATRVDPKVLLRN